MEKTIHIKVDEKLLEQFDTAMEKDAVDPNRSAVIRMLMREYIERMKKDDNEAKM